MFSVSRTALPDTTFQPLPRHKALNNDSIRITMNESRQSTMSISTDLFPELLSWSAFIDMTQRSTSASPPLPQGMPNDIAEDDIFDDDILTESEFECHPSLSLSRIFDPTTLSIGFDVSYFNGLDEQLIYSPRDAFLDLCWSNGVYRHPSQLKESPETVSAPSLPSRSNLSSIESDPGPEEYSQTQFEDTNVRVQQFDSFPPIKLSSYDVEKNPFIKDLLNFDYSYNRDTSVGAFPVPIVKQSKAPRGLSSFRSQWSFGRP